MKSVEENKKRRRKAIILLLIFIISITIGYSILSQTLNIIGISRINKVTWDIHFENIDITNNSNVTAVEIPIAKQEDKTTILNYEVNLHKPGEVYEFTVDAVNDGSVDAKLVSAPQISGISNEQMKYINFEFTYFDDAAIAAGDIINSGKSAKYKVRIEYRDDISNNALPTTGQDLEMSIKLDFEQA